MSKRTRLLRTKYPGLDDNEIDRLDIMTMQIELGTKDTTKLTMKQACKMAMGILENEKKLQPIQP